VPEVSGFQIPENRVGDLSSWILVRGAMWSGFLKLPLSEIRSPVRIGPRRSLRAWIRGFDRLSYLIYDLDHNDPADYVNRFENSTSMCRINGAYDYLINNKLVGCWILRALDLPQPEVFGSVRNGRFVGIPGNVSQTSTSILSLLDRGPLVMKPVRGLKGIGFMRLVRLPGGSLELNGIPISESFLKQVIAGLKEFLVTEFVKQAEYSERIFPSTTNTVRLLTFLDGETNQSFLAAAAHRFGRSKSVPVDNWRYGLGGLSASIDPQNGILGKAALLDDNRTLKWLDSHPKTGERIAGVRIPSWDTLLRAVLAGAEKIPFAPALAWDVIVTEDHFKILEINGRPGLGVHQVHGPLLANPRVRRFLEHYGVIRRERN